MLTKGRHNKRTYEMVGQEVQTQTDVKCMPGDLVALYYIPSKINQRICAQSYI